MITLIETLRFRCLRDVSQPLGAFHVLVGPNASGKTTFLDVLTLLGKLVSEDLDAAVRDRTQNFEELLWKREGRSFEIAIEARIPDERRHLLEKPSWDTIRYEVAIGLQPGTDEIGILCERALLKKAQPIPPRQRTLFPERRKPRDTILSPKSKRGTRTVLNKGMTGADNFYDETGKGWDHSFKLGPRKSALANLPEDESKFPAAAWLKNTLMTGIQQIILNSLLIRKASPPGQVRGFKPDGSNLPWVIAELERNHPGRLKDWIEHLRTALPDIERIRTRERPDDRHRYLVITYRGGLEVPSWLASDGTLRLLALTLPPYLPDFSGVYLIEEPENGIHPRAVETMFQSLSSAYKAQILLATHSPVILSIVRPENVLCFARSAEGETDIVSGKEHPALKKWRGETNLGTLFASGVLG